MSHELPATEGYLSFAGYRTWYRVTGEREEPGRFPLLCLHGGPGATWHHMEPYTELAADGRRVVCYDQLGCGKSAVHVPDPGQPGDRCNVGSAPALRILLSSHVVSSSGQFSSWRSRGDQMISCAIVVDPLHRR
jgi:pimeloyl-ACP methyl ester carboxylesterase